MFPFHAAYIFNNLGKTFYINGTPNEFLTAWNICIYPWWMTTLFLLAGMSVKYSLKKRTIKQFLFERIKRLLVPLIFSLLLIIPPQSYFAKIFHSNWKGNYWDFYRSYFKITDLSGLDGYFSPGNAWFILYLFIFSVLFSPILAWFSKKILI